MKKSTFISVAALMVALAGAVVALAAYFKDSCPCCDDYDLDDFDEDDFDYIDAEVEEDEEADTQGENSETEPETKPTQLEDK